jgi:hypothetical protein
MIAPPGAIVCITFLQSVIHTEVREPFSKVPYTLRKRTIAPPGAIVRKTLLQSVIANEEANDRTSLGDCSLSHHAPKGA